MRIKGISLPSFKMVAISGAKKLQIITMNTLKGVSIFNIKTFIE